MRKLFSALLIVLFLATQAWPAALTLTDEEHHTIGDLNIVTGTAAVNSGDTLTLGSGPLLAVMLRPRRPSTAPGASSYSYRISTTVITISTSADGNTWNFVIIGSGF